MLIYFVVLHYQNIDDTINCLNSIKKMKKIDDINIKIVLIDNKSPNNSGKVLKKMYENDPIIHTILLDENFGFSKANNIGYKYAKENNPDMIIVNNNDVIFEDVCFLKKLYKNNKKEQYSNYELIIPDVINLNNFHQNPMKIQEMSLLKAYKNYFYKKIISILLKIPYLRIGVYNFEDRREKKWMNDYYGLNKEETIQDYFVPIGAFVIYNQKWILSEEIAFPSTSFMYCEEDFLVKYIKEKKYKMYYDKELKVRHLEGRSVQMINIDKCKVLSIKYKNQANAIKKYIKFLKGDCA